MSFVKTIDAEVKRTSGQVLRKKLRQANTSATGATLGDSDFVLKNGYLYTVVRAISARVNQNYDGWPSDELKLSYKTFVGKPVFVNHRNDDPSKARGRVIAARYFENGADKGIECIMEVDAQRFPRLAHEIRTGGLDSVSMGAEAGHTICSMCGNTATDTHDMCDHVKFHKGEHLMKNGKPQLVYETCHKLGFFELSYVFDPADETAVVSKVIQANRRTAEQGSYPDCTRCGHSARAHDYDDEFAFEAHPPTYCHAEGCDCTAYATTKAAHVLAAIADAYAPRERSMSIEAMIHRAYGEVEAPESVDTLRQEEEGSEEDFHSYVETPAELRDPNLDRTQQLDREQEREGLDQDRNVEDVEGWEAPDHAANEQAAMRSDQQYLAAMGTSPVNGRSSRMNERRAREEDTMARRSSLASRGKTAAQGRQRTAEGPLTDGGDQSVNAQSTREPGEEEFITPTPSGEAVDLGDGHESGAAGALVARMQHTQQQLLRDAARLQALQAKQGGAAPAPQSSGNRQRQIAQKIAWMQQRLGRRLTADESAAVATSVPETADTVNPALSGTDDQSLKGQNFQPADPNSGVQTTQPKDASRQTFAAFDRWFTSETGVRPHVAAVRDERYVLTAAKTFADHHGFNPDAYFPVMGAMLRQAKAQGGAMRRRADSAEELRAPSGRVDVEAPTNDTTDAEAQASQFDIGDFGHNAGDNLADPDLSTDSVTWAPGEGKKEGAFKRASTAAAVRAADLFVEAGLRPKEDRYNLISMHETMRAGQVADRIAMCELFLQRRAADQQRFAAQQRRVASGVSRGAASAALPPGFGSGQVRTAGRGALEDRSTDGLLFM